MLSRLKSLVAGAQSTLIARYEPYVFVESHAERLFWRYLELSPAQVKAIVIVGAWQGIEIPGLVRRYPSAEIFAFEPSPSNFDRLHDRYSGNRRVHCFCEAISDSSGTLTFHEASLPGTGSLLPLSEEEVAQRHNDGLYQRNSLTVTAATLDEHDAIRRLPRIDLLKVDVQGAELRVLAGASSTLERTAAVLIEVGLMDSAYEGAVRFGELDARLNQGGFLLCGLGVDPITLDGNALYVREEWRRQR